MFRRLFLFLAVNLLVVLTISVLVRAAGIDPALARSGVSLSQLGALCLIWGFSGSLVSLAISRLMAKLAYGVRVIDPGQCSPEEAALVRSVHALAREAGLEEMPEVGVYDSPEVNAFATGPTRSRSLVAVSTGLLRTMDRREVEGVLAHEVSHVANGDMVTMALLQGVVNAFVFFLSRVIALAISRGGNGKGSRGTNVLVVMALELVLGLLGTMVVMWFSRQREYRADAGAARLVGTGGMIAALQRLQGMNPGDAERESLATMKISGAPRFLSLFSSHPPLEERIARLRGA
jgi:heat shock protein HtpX